jgi:hypothetical protein
MKSAIFPSKRAPSFLQSGISWKLFLCVMLMTLSSFSPIQAQTNAPQQRSNRYLLIVEASRSMQKRTDGVFGSIQDLLVSKMGGQLKDGDTIGVWTYNEDLGTGHLGVQRWATNMQEAVTGRILSFLKAQRFEKRGNFEKVVIPLAHVVKSSEVLTTILMADGMEEVHGTPFDDRINNAFKVWRSQQQEARMPFVVVLRAVKGAFTECTVNPAPWVIELPPLPPEPQVAKVTPKPTVAPAPKPPPTLPPLILSGKKPDPQVPPKTAEADPNQVASRPNSEQLQQQNPAQPPVLQTALVPASAATGTSQTVATTAPAATLHPNVVPTTPGRSTELPPVQNGNLKANELALAATTQPQMTPTPQSKVVPSPPPQVQQASPSEASSQPLAQLASATNRSGPASSFLWISAAGLALVFIAGLLLLGRNRSGPSAVSSLITESFDRNRK